jgi:hypothetical protein
MGDMHYELNIKGPIVVRMGDPTDTNVVEAAQNLSAHLSVPVTVVGLDGPPQAPTYTVTLRINPPDHPLVAQLAELLSERLGVPVILLPLGREEQ